jgi:arylsulfatase A-like enzyme
MTRRALVTGLAALWLVLGAGCAGRLFVRPERGPAPVLLLTIDSLRPDHLGAYGYGRETSPALAAFAEDSVTFRNAFTAGGWTSPGLVSLFSGAWPSVHGVVARERSAPPELHTPLEALRSARYRVPDLFRFQEVENYRHLGFEPMEPARADVSALLEWIGAHQGEPFLVAYHLRTVHLPYDPPPPHDRYFREALAASGQERPSSGVEAVRTQARVFKGTVELDAGDRPLVEALYDGEVEAQDEEVRQILNGLRDLGLYDRLLIVVTADHGEELLDHGFVGHASTSLDGTLHDEIMRVPLIVKFPDNCFAGRRIEPPVRTVDILPTVLDWLGIRPDPTWAGRSLLPLIRSKRAPSPGPAIAETSSCGWTCPSPRYAPDGRYSGQAPRYLRAVRTERYKLIEVRDGNTMTFQLYDLQNDPREQNDIAAADPDVVKELRALLPAPLANASRGSGIE